MTPVRLLFVLTSPVRGGVEEVVLALLKRLDPGEFRLGLAAPGPLLDAAAHRRGEHEQQAHGPHAVTSAGAGTVSPRSSSSTPRTPVMWSTERSTGPDASRTASAVGSLG